MIGQSFAPYHSAIELRAAVGRTSIGNAHNASQSDLYGGKDGPAEMQKEQPIHARWPPQHLSLLLRRTVVEYAGHLTGDVLGHIHLDHVAIELRADVERPSARIIYQNYPGTIHESSMSRNRAKMTAVLSSILCDKNELPQKYVIEESNVHRYVV